MASINLSLEVKFSTQQFKIFASLCNDTLMHLSLTNDHFMAQNVKINYGGHIREL